MMKKGFFFSPLPVLTIEVDDTNVHGVVDLHYVAIRTVTITLGWLLWRWSIVFDWRYEPGEDWEDETR